MTPRERLTPKEIQIAILVWEGLTNREIGRIVGTSEQVIKNHLRSAFDKVGVWSRLELALYVAAHGGAHWRDPADLPVGSASSPAEISHALQASAPAVSVRHDKDDHRSSLLAHKSKAPPGLISA